MQRDEDIIRQEQIEEMAKDFCGVPCVAKKGRTHCDKLCEIYIFARRIYDACSRKADDVRKETAKEILQCIYDKCYEIQNIRCGGIAHILPIDILQLAKHYGIEVEE